MAKTGSYIKLDRGLKTNTLWLSEKPFTKGQAWVDLLLLAQGISKDKEYRGRIQQMKAGEIYTSILFLEKRWGWSRNKIYRFLSQLQNAGMIAVKGWEKTEQVNGTSLWTRNGTTDGTTITVVNWALYQYDGTSDGTTDGTSKRNNRTEHTIESIYRESNTRESKQKNKRGRCAPPDSPSGEPETEPGRDEGTYEDIPVKHRDGTYHSFETYADYWDWRNQ